MARAVRDEGVLLAPEAMAAAVREVADALAGLGPVQPLLRRPEVTDVMVNGPGEVWIEHGGRLERTDVYFRGRRGRSRRRRSTCKSAMDDRERIELWAHRMAYWLLVGRPERLQAYMFLDPDVCERAMEILAELDKEAEDL